MTDLQMAGLVERQIDFAYDYAMRCASCASTHIVSAGDYHAQENNCRVSCSTCAAEIHFGPAVARPRDLQDPSLDDEAIGGISWYHTSTEAVWPSLSRKPMEHGPFVRHLSPSAVQRIEARHADQALHLGTYEAAVESMLRRMSDQDDGASQFYLYRVCLKRDVFVEPGFRDENKDEAAVITQTAIRNSGYQGIRYLNVHEAQGSISLAVCRDAIEAVQVIPVPTPGIAVSVQKPLVPAVEALWEQCAVLPPPSRSTPSTRKPANIAGHAPTLEYYKLQQNARDLIAASLLPNISPVVRDHVSDALRAWQDTQSGLSPSGMVKQWASTSALLTMPEKITTCLRKEPQRIV